MRRNPRWSALFRRIEGRLKAGKSSYGNRNDIQELLAIAEIKRSGKQENGTWRESMRKRMPFIAAACLILVAIVVAPIAFALDADSAPPAIPASATPTLEPSPSPIPKSSFSLETHWPYVRQLEISQLTAFAEYEMASETSQTPSPTSSPDIPDEDRLTPAATETPQTPAPTATPDIPDEDRLTPAETETPQSKSDDSKTSDKKADTSTSKEKTDSDSSSKKTESEKKTASSESKSSSKSSSKSKSKSKKEEPIEVKAVVKLRNDDREDRDPPTESQIVKTLSYEVTAYTHTGEKTAKGNWPAVGTIAVNPKQIPYGTLLYVEGYGYGIADDTGAFRHSGKKQIDLFMDSESECVKWGRRRNVTVYIVKN